MSSSNPLDLSGVRPPEARLPREWAGVFAEDDSSSQLDAAQVLPSSWTGAERLSFFCLFNDRNWDISQLWGTFVTNVVFFLKKDKKKKKRLWLYSTMTVPSTDVPSQRVAETHPEPRGRSLERLLFAQMKHLEAPGLQAAFNCSLSWLQNSNYCQRDHQSCWD